MNSPKFVVTLAFVCASLFISAACQQANPAKTVALAAEDEKAPQTRPTPANQEPITIAAVGDIMLYSTFPDDTRVPPNDGKDLLKEVTPILSGADVAFGNLEGPMLEGGTSEKCGTPVPGKPIRCFAFRVPPRYGKYLKDAGFDILNLANNHAGDFGDEGRRSTRQTLDALGIKHAGSDRNQFASTILEVKGKKIAFIGFAHNNISLNVNELDAARRVVQEAARKADLVVVSFHGGAEGTDAQHVPKQTEIFIGEKRGNLPAFAHTVIDAGADLVLGHGPHVLRGMEVYKDRLIAYSLGNFATYGWFGLKAETALTMILEAEIAADGKFIKGKIHPGRQEGRGGPILDKTNRTAIATVRNLSAQDFPASAPSIKDDGTILPTSFSSQKQSR